MKGTNGRQFFGANASAFLDVIRFCAALAVALTHMASHYVLAGPLISHRSGNAAVCVFFVLSGFIIRLVSVSREGNGWSYAIDRSTRLYSVVIPMLGVTFCIEPLVRWLSPAVFQMLAQPFRWRDIPIQATENLLFTVDWWGLGSVPLSNGAFWSLSYEFVYYALYGIWFYVPRYRWWMIPSVLVLVGPAISLLFPIWILGVLLFDGYKALSDRPHGESIAYGLSGSLLVLMTLFRKSLVSFLERTTVSNRSVALNAFLRDRPVISRLLPGNPSIWLDHVSVSFVVTATVTAAVLLPILLSLDRLPLRLPDFGSKLIRVVADSTFPLYLLHGPLFLLLACLYGGPLPNWSLGLLALAFAIVASILAGIACDRFKCNLRAYVTLGERR